MSSKRTEGSGKSAVSSAKTQKDESGFSNLVRIGLALMGAGAFVFAGFAMARDTSPELGATALIIMGAISLLLALFGKMPPIRLSGWGFELEFSKDTLKKILDVVQSEAPDIFDAVANIASGGTRTRTEVSNVIAAARAEKQDDTKFEAGFLISSGAKSLLAFDGFRPNPVVANTPGRGRPPIIDAAFDFGGTKIAVEMKSNWNPTTADLVRQRLLRVLTSPDFGAAVLIVPDSVLAAASAALTDSRIVVISEDQVATLEKLLPEALNSN